ncbi:MAG: hypothetical protein Kow0065_01340 [Methylomicrobium sp.]
MFKNLLHQFQALTAERATTFDPSRFDDPLAMHTDWHPLQRGGANFRTHKLVDLGYGRIEFQASTAAKLFYSVFLWVGLGMSIGISVTQLATATQSFDADIIVPIVFGLFFSTIGASLWYFGTMPIVFDKRTGFFWKGRNAPSRTHIQKNVKYCVPLASIHALQIIVEHCKGNKSAYYSYELNLILTNGQRVNVIDHGNLDKLREDARMLALFLGKPVWDAT